MEEENLCLYKGLRRFVSEESSLSINSHGDGDADEKRDQGRPQDRPILPGR